MPSLVPSTEQRHKTMSQREHDLLIALKACLDRLEHEAAASWQAIVHARNVIFQTEIAIAAEAARKAESTATTSYRWVVEEALESYQ